MGCLNPNQGFEHVFGNIHLSAPYCNRSCPFCIGQFMMELDHYNTLDKWPMEGMDEFIEKCREQKVSEINLTGTNTEPLLFKHISELHQLLDNEIPDLKFGIRTNGVLVTKRLDDWALFDKGSVTICSLDDDIYKAMMGRGCPPDIAEIVRYSKHMPDLKVNIVLGPENTANDDLDKTLRGLAEAGITRVNLREPYGQPHVGDPLVAAYEPEGQRLGMPYYTVYDMDCQYWDVHYCEVESVNLYASGRVSLLYPITEGYSPNGLVRSQDHFPGGRMQKQWLGSQAASEKAALALRERLMD